ncbi:P-type ATPase [Heterostelium album PN500]|uniref:P-type Cu(+) transporter n=1 Tax=Heterostelium pallidum (strain ATCC 26659 / Pp 5 / PN500) TaxID=670386 RepID=D3BUW0_HETP5|nr:P-type ATPase [Heterostelium album PN500]EFA74898.1 P-type ATPase [Heterostelium album PN500]|eukprot:XP_020427032.1 P-type ATPase [Heterostelium album PN500]
MATLIVPNLPVSGKNAFDSCSCSCVKCLCNKLLDSITTYNDASDNFTMEVAIQSCCSTDPSNSNTAANATSSISSNCGCESNSCCGLSTLFSYQDFTIFVPNLEKQHIEPLEKLLNSLSTVLSAKVNNNKFVEIHTNSQRSIFSILSVFKSLNLTIASVQSNQCPKPSSLDDIDIDDDFISPEMNGGNGGSANYSSEDEKDEKIFQISGMVCQLGCAKIIETKFMENSRISNAYVNFSAQTLHIRGDVSDRSVIRKVEKLGFKCERIKKDQVSLISPIDQSPVCIIPQKNNNNNSPKQQQQQQRATEIEMISIESSPVKESFPEIKVETPSSETNTIAIGVYGMTCASCVGIVEHGVKSVAGVVECSVNLLAERAEVTYHPAVATLKDILEILDTLGYETKVLHTPKPGTFFIAIDEMPSTSNALDAQNSLSSLSGVTSVEPHENDNGKIVFKIEADALVVGPRSAIRKLAESKIVATLYSPDTDEAKDSLLRKREIQKWRRYFIFSIAFTAPLIVIAMILTPAKVPFVMKEITMGLPVEALLGFILATPVQFYTGLTYYKASWGALRNLHGNMDLLVAIGSSAAYIYSVLSIVLGMANPDYMGMHFFETSASLITFITLGRWLENIAKGHTSSAIVKLMNLQSKESILINANYDEEKGTFEALSEEIIPSNLIQYNDILKVVPGASVPTDGVVIYGTSSIDESMLTGESVPVSKKPGDDITGGTVNLEGAVYVRANKVGSESTLSQIISLVQQAQTSKAPIQEIADKISKVFVPGIVLIGLFTFALWMILGATDAYPEKWRNGNSSFLFSFLASIAVIVIACPCALGLATPTAVMVGTGVGAQLGILIKGGKALETAHKTSAVLFDKTGTITTGKMTVTEYQTPDNSPAHLKEFFTFVGSAESGSEHPIGRAIVKYCKEKLAAEDGRSEKEIQFPMVEDFKGVPGRGLVCHIEGNKVLIGNLSFMKENDIKVDQRYVDAAQEMETNGKTVIYIMYKSEFRGIMSISDVPRDDSMIAIKKLHQLGLKCYMVTGDNRRAAKFISKEVGIPEENIFSEVIPKEKADKVRQLQEQGHVVCFVGDGINDSPALSQADVAVSVATGTDIAIESSSIVLLKNSLTDVYRSIHLSRVVFRRIRINFTLALIYNLCAVPLAAGLFLVIFGVELPPMAAAAAMVIISDTTDYLPVPKIFFIMVQIARNIHDTLKNTPEPYRKERSKEFRVQFSIFVSIELPKKEKSISSTEQQMEESNGASSMTIINVHHDNNNCILLEEFLWNGNSVWNGTLIFIMYCILNKDIKESYRKSFEKLKNSCRKNKKNIHKKETKQKVEHHQISLPQLCIEINEKMASRNGGKE